MRKHILSIGNSFSDDAHMYLYDILKTDGIEDIIIANLYIGGCTLEKHANNIMNDSHDYEFKIYDNNGFHIYYNYSINDGLKFAEWDYITFQQASYNSGIAETYFSDEGIIYFDILRNHIINTIKYLPKFLFHKTWSYEKGFDGNTFKIYNYSQELMENKIDEVFEEIIKNYKYFDGYIYSMDSIKELRLIHGRPVTRDGFHLYLGVGRYTASLAFAKAVNENSKLYSSIEYDLVNEKEKEQARSAVIKINN